MSQRNGSCRTINLTDSRRRQLAVVAAHFNTTSEAIIQSGILALLLTLSEQDRILGYSIARAGDMDWDDLTHADYGEILSAIGVK